MVKMDWTAEDFLMLRLYLAVLNRARLFTGDLKALRV
jgi:hypothetical protein